MQTVSHVHKRVNAIVTELKEHSPPILAALFVAELNREMIPFVKKHAEDLLKQLDFDFDETT